MLVLSAPHMRRNTPDQNDFSKDPAILHRFCLPVQFQFLLKVPQQPPILLGERGGGEIQTFTIQSELTVLAAPEFLSCGQNPHSWLCKGSSQISSSLRATLQQPCTGVNYLELVFLLAYFFPNNFLLNKMSSTHIHYHSHIDSMLGTLTVYIYVKHTYRNYTICHTASRLHECN